MQQVIVIHGGSTYAQYDAYIKDLATKPLNPERYRFKPMWKERLQQQLGAQYEVLLPTMPNKTNAQYSEWKVWFDHFSDIIADDCILIGHSLGAIFLAKYLSEAQFARRIKATILIAAPYDDESSEDLTDFKLNRVGERFIEQAGSTTLFFGNDDPVISQDEIHKYERDLPEATFHVMSAPDHFVREDFPELISAIKEL